jgi:hypothetical protein
MMPLSFLDEMEHGMDEHETKVHNETNEHNDTQVTDDHNDTKVMMLL